MEMNWSRWFRCESSFGLLLVPTQPGIYALAEEIASVASPQSRRMLAVIEVDETTDLARSLSRLFAAGSPWREKLEQGRCFLRYAVVSDANERRAAAGALKQWLTSQRDTASRVLSEFALAEPVPAVMLDHEREPATVSERAVDRVARTAEYEKVFRARV